MTETIQAKWKDGETHLEGEYTHGLIVLPTAEPGEYRLAFAANSREELAMLCASVLGMILDAGLADEVRDVMQRSEMQRVDRSWPDKGAHQGEVH